MFSGIDLLFFGGLVEKVFGGDCFIMVEEIIEFIYFGISYFDLNFDYISIDFIDLFDVGEELLYNLKSISKLIRVILRN